MRKVFRFCAMFFLVSVLSGCWDQRMLKDARIVDISGFDLDSEGKLETTTSVLDVSGSQSGRKDLNEIHTVRAHTTRQMRDALDREVSGNYSPSKLRVILLGEALARQAVYPVLDVFYRDSKSALNAKIAVVAGTAHDVISIKKAGTKLIGEHFNKLILSVENATIVPEVNVQLICPSMLDQGDDFAVPYIKNGKNPSVYGMALFNDDKMTGTLNADESLLYLLMADKLAKTASLTLKANEEGKLESEKYITIDIQRIKRNLKVNVQDNRNIQVALDLKLKVTAIEYAKDHLDEKRIVGQLDKRLSEELTRRAKDITQKMLRFNHDGFGIGRRLMAYYPDVWKRLEWTKDYPKIEFVPKVTAEIVDHGIIN